MNKMEEDLVTVFCISCGFVSTAPRRAMSRETERMVCPKCRYSFRLSKRVTEGRIRPLPAGVLMV